MLFDITGIELLVWFRTYLGDLHMKCDIDTSEITILMKFKRNVRFSIVRLYIITYFLDVWFPRN